MRRGWWTNDIDGIVLRGIRPYFGRIVVGEGVAGGLPYSRPPTSYPVLPEHFSVGPLPNWTCGFQPIRLSSVVTVGSVWGCVVPVAPSACVRGRQAASSLLTRGVSVGSDSVPGVCRVGYVVNRDFRWVSELTVVTYGDLFCLVSDGTLDHVEQAVDGVEVT